MPMHDVDLQVCSPSLHCLNWFSRCSSAWWVPWARTKPVADAHLCIPVVLWSWTCLLIDVVFFPFSLIRYGSPPGGAISLVPLWFPWWFLWLQNCYYVDTMTSCRLKGFVDTVRFYFQGGFSFLTILRWAKHSFGRLRLPLTSYVTVPGLALVTAPFLSSLSIIWTSTAAVRFTYILCACMCVLMSVIQCRRYRGAGGRAP